MALWLVEAHDRKRSQMTTTISYPIARPTGDAQRVRLIGSGPDVMAALGDKLVAAGVQYVGRSGNVTYLIATGEEVR